MRTAITKEQNTMNVMKIKNREKYDFIMAQGGYKEYLIFQENLKQRVGEIVFDLTQKRKLAKAIRIIYPNQKFIQYQVVYTFAFATTDGLCQFNLIKRMMKLVELYENGKI